MYLKMAWFSVLSIILGSHSVIVLLSLMYRNGPQAEAVSSGKKFHSREENLTNTSIHTSLQAPGLILLEYEQTSWSHAWKFFNSSVHIISTTFQKLSLIKHQDTPPLHVINIINTRENFGSNCRQVRLILVQLLCEIGACLCTFIIPVRRWCLAARHCQISQEDTVSTVTMVF